jgi:nitrate reductase gamma subunit
MVPHWPQIMTPGVTLICQLSIILALAAGVFRLIRRILVPEMRVISSPDDYFSIIILNIYLVAALIGITYLHSTYASIAFFGMTTFFLIYVPFSKISHYLYYPFNKYFVGKHLGHRGVYPKNYQENQLGCKDA